MEAFITDPSAVDESLKRWKGSTGSERSNFQSFMRDLCILLGLPHPDPGKGDKSLNSYVFERFIDSPRVDGNTDNRYIDLYRRDCFVLEGKQTGKELASQSHQNSINAAVAQAERFSSTAGAADGIKPSTNIYFLGVTLSTEQQVSGSVGKPNKISRSQAITWRCRKNHTKLLLNMRISDSWRNKKRYY